MRVLLSKWSLFIVLLSSLTHAGLDTAFANDAGNLGCDPYHLSISGPIRELSDDINNLDEDRTIEGIVILVDFEDRRQVQSDPAKLVRVFEMVSDFYLQVSEGYIRINWTMFERVIRLPERVKEYQAGARGSIGTAKIVVDAQKILFADNPRANPDYVVVVTPSSTLKSEVTTSISYLDRNEGIVNSSLLSSDFWTSKASWTIAAHELGHAFGLLDLYSYESAYQLSQGNGAYLEQFQFMKVYDLMNWPMSKSPTFTMWNRIRLSEKLSSRIICFAGKDSEYRLIPINRKQEGYKAIMIPLSEFKVLMVEVRDDISYDSAISKSDVGVITYVVDPTKGSGMGPLKIDCRRARKAKKNECSLKQGQSRIIEGMLISVLESSVSEHVVAVREVGQIALKKLGVGF